MLVATHSYKPLSARLKFLMVRVPWLTSVLPAGKGNTADRLQVITGRGYPSAWHFAWNLVPCAGEASEGGTVVKIGRPDNCDWKLWLKENKIKEAALPSGQRVGIAMRLSQVRDALWSLTGFVFCRPEFKSLATLLNSQLVASCQLGSVMSCLNYLCLCIWVQNACKLAG